MSAEQALRLNSLRLGNLRRIRTALYRRRLQLHDELVSSREIFRILEHHPDFDPGTEGQASEEEMFATLARPTSALDEAVEDYATTDPRSPMNGVPEVDQDYADIMHEFVETGRNLAVVDAALNASVPLPDTVHYSPAA